MTLSTSIMKKITLNLTNNIITARENNTHFSIILDRIGSEVVTPDEYLTMIDDDHLGMEVWLTDQLPLPWCELSLASLIGLIVCGTDFDFFSSSNQARDQGEHMLIIECLYIDHYSLLGREDELFELWSCIDRRHHDMRWDTRYILVAHMCPISSEYTLEESECSSIRRTIDIFAIFGKKWCRPIPSTDRVGIIDDPELRMGKRIPMIIGVDDFDSCTQEFFGYWNIDFWCTKNITLQHNLHIESSLFCSDDRIWELRSISPSIYLDPDTLLGTIDTADQLTLRVWVGERVNSTIRYEYLPRFSTCLHSELWILTEKMLMIRARTARYEQKRNQEIYSQRHTQNF